MPCPKSPKVNWLDKVRFIRHYAMNSCDTTLKVYVEMGTRADTNLVLGFVNTSPKDFAYFFFRPKGSRTDRHGIRRLKRNKSIGAQGGEAGEAAVEEKYEAELFPDTAKLAADTLRSSLGLSKPVYNELGTLFYDVARPIIRGAYYLFLVNMVTDFAFDWYSGILLAPESKCTLGRFDFAFAGSYVRDDGWMRITPLQSVYRPTHASLHLDGMHIDDGVWVFRARIANIPEFEFFGSGTLYAQFMLGLSPPVPCGPIHAIPVASTGVAFVKDFVVKLAGAEIVNLWFFWDADDPLRHINLSATQVEGFVT